MKTVWKIGLRLLGAALAAGLLGSCAIAPASLQRTDLNREAECPDCGKSLEELIAVALKDPASETSSHALAHFVEEWKEQRGTDSGMLAVPRADASVQRLRIRFVMGAHGGYSLDYFDEIRPAIDYQVEKIAHHRRAGYGAPLVALRENRGRTPLERFYPPEAISRPLTAVVLPGASRGGVREVRIELLCPLQNDEVLVRGARRPLAADFSVPWAAFLARTGELNKSGVADLLFREPQREPQLYLMEPYQPEKIPLIMIHGLLDTPLAWMQLSNDLWADDEIRSRYQIWQYLYNTSAPALYSGRILSTQLRELRPMLDADGRDPAMRSTTLLSHSMGGLVSRRLITRPGDAFWKAAFTQPMESLQLSADDRAQLQEAFFWEPAGHVDRVIYIAVPHRGSGYADNVVGRIGRWLVKPPNRFEAFYHRISSANPGAFTPAYAALGEGKLDSVNALSPRQPTLQILAQLPNGQPVTEYSIIGDRGKSGPLEESSDGVVPYWSSHLPRAASEKIVPVGHSAIDHEVTVLEVKRILKLR
jgi:pimeloyl-ACP methyl ester carboxylesterase